MQLKIRSVRGRLANFLSRLRSSSLAQLEFVGEAPPLRSELLSADQMESHGKILANTHRLIQRRCTDQLLDRLSQNEKILIDVCDVLTAAVKEKRRIAPAGEWLLDNFYLIEDQIRTARRHFPKGYSQELPCLAHGPSDALPRVYDIALEAISHGDGWVDPESLNRFVTAYQTVTVLTLGELWAIPIMLRLALIENLRRVAVKLAIGTIDRDLADTWSNRMMEIAEKDPKSLILVIADMARSNPPVSSSFVAELARRLQGQSPALALSLNWIEQLLSESNLTIEQLVQAETQTQAADQVSISNTIGSLRFLGAMDWRKFVETMSVVEKILLEDPANAYSKMDFSTRDRYRHVVEKISKVSRFSESEVATFAIQLARKGMDIEDRTSHVGFYLIDQGLLQLEQVTQVKFGILESLQRFVRSYPLFFYLGSIVSLTTAIVVGLLTTTFSEGLRGWPLVGVSVLVTLCVSHLAVALVNWMATIVTTPYLLPRMELSNGIPSEFRTLVVVPSMLGSPKNIEDLVEALEVRYLANTDENLCFGLLTDFQDATEETLSEDDSLISLAATRIEELNTKYQNVNCPPFYLFHRPRRWNAQEKVWMGYERKRGKLGELNALIRGRGEDNFLRIVGVKNALLNVKFVITLDTDTHLPRDSARQFIGAMMHPLNRPQFDDDGNRITKGYGILQPRVAASHAGTAQSRYARLFGSEPGIDPYTRAVSDVYQDIFGEGSFIGKGIYDVDAFERALKGRLPENRILSHDLLEGCYARAGLLSDVQLYEEFPKRYDVDVSRRHRWIRGDWQIASWVLPWVPNSRLDSVDKSSPNILSALSQWKIIDNLRRSLIPAALLSLLILGWTFLSLPLFWTVAAIVIVVTPPVFASIVDLFRKEREVLLSQHFRKTLHSLGENFTQIVFMFACLPYEAYVNLDAIVRTNWRILVTRRHLLQWIPSSNLENNDRTSLAAYYQKMWIAPAISVAVAAYLIVAIPARLPIAWPILCLWMSSPLMAWWFSRGLTRDQVQLTKEQNIFLRKAARKTWAFFETFVGSDDHWLPPDNFQEHPAPVIAHRTSPTNMGLSLLANLAAYDFGYVQAGQFIERTMRALHTMEALERYQGHFYNWYDTQTLKPLAPLYVSTVDSGNLAGHLLVLRSGLLALPDQKILTDSVFNGLGDVLGILIDASEPTNFSYQDQLRKEQEFVYEFRATTLADARASLVRMATFAAELADCTNSGEVDEGARWWIQALARQCEFAIDELSLFAPWLEVTPPSERIRKTLDTIEISTLRELAAGEANWLTVIEHEVASTATYDEREWCERLRQDIRVAMERAEERMLSIDRLALQTGNLANMRYDFLFDNARHLLAIGYNASEHRLDASHYDLLASEARLCNFVAIAQGQLPQDSWFALGRLLTSAGGKPTLLSWSGSMFEYLMPLLVMPTYDNTLLDHTYQAAVERQIAYGDLRGVAWGISESGYNTVDVHLNYQYRAFGVPGLGLKRGLTEDLVITPYATALALMVFPDKACLNLQRLASEGMMSKYGFYEAVDYTQSRLPRGQLKAVIRSFMAHHQGMIFLSLAYHMLNRPMQKRFQAEPIFQATALLLQERVPKAGAFQLHTSELSSIRAATNDPEMPVRVISSSGTPVPEVQLLSNGRYHVMVTNAGGGYSRWKDLAVSRWREDTTCDNWGTFCYIRDVTSGVFWSNTHQPALKRAETYEAIFSEGRAEFRRRDFDYETHTEIVVSPEDDIELRRVRITNRAKNRRTIEITSYSEVVLAVAAADALHPAFSNLFVQTEIVRDRQAILCTRRPRSVEEQAPWMLHLMAVRSADFEEVTYETDRMEFIGRGRTVAAPRAMDDALAFSGSQGSVLDPIVAIRYRIALDAGQTATIDMVFGVGETRDTAINLAAKYQDRHLADRVFELAWTHSQVVLRQINAMEADAQLYARLASSIIYSNASLRADASVIIKNRRGQSGLWGYAISGDLPIVLVQIGDLTNIELVRQMVQAHAYWRLKGLTVDLVIWNEDRAGYRQLLQEQIMGLIAAGVEAHVMDKPGGIFVRRAEQISDEDRTLVQSVARIIITDRRGALADQINRRNPLEVRSPHLNIPRFKPTRVLRSPKITTTNSLPRNLLFDNGLGGFSNDGREYVITTAHGHVTPAPWVNVLANAHFGTVISESGMAYTWNENAHEFRLTPWGNDPISDGSGEAFYLRDEESGHFWSPTPLPSRGATPYISRHGFGYSVFEHSEEGISSEFTAYVAVDAAVKFSVLKIRNESGRSCRLSATGYLEWVLGDLKSKTAMHVITEIDPISGALLARNSYNTEFSNRIAFFDVDEKARTVSGDRAEFIGRNGTLKNPAAMMRSHLSNKVGAALDPCAAIQIAFDLSEGEERVIVFTLGVGRDVEDARKLIQRFRGSVAARDALEKANDYWQRILGAVQVETPDQSLNVLTNGWLLYQTLACRLWGRSGYYQSGGAFGFRDQLQDVMALIHADSRLAREHLLRCAGHQFREGDVQHWWHPPSDRGVRTHCSDDYLWLPLATSRYVLSTGDKGVLAEIVPFLDGRPVNQGEDSYYDLPGRSDESATLYEHCVRAIVNGLTFGGRGLPLMGSGDWNDGMNLVGLHGKGESVWLAFFLYEVLMQFTEIARLRGDSTFAERCQREAAQLRQNIERNGWDGEWYRRAYFDDGTPLGSTTNSECQIDAIAQSWAVLSGAGDPRRTRMAMAAVDRRLVRREHTLIQLLDPPFDKSTLNPGYIKGYVPGVRENGGQYTHSAIWTAMAFATLGDNRRAWELFSMINPINHANSEATVATYKVEPYVVAADVYAVAPHIGRGGWTWYTGSAGWLYRLILESLLGLKLEVDRLRFAPCLPTDWKRFKVGYRYKETTYDIVFLKVDGMEHKIDIVVDSVRQPNESIFLVNDRLEHIVEVKYSAPKS